MPRLSEEVLKVLKVDVTFEISLVVGGNPKTAYQTGLKVLQIACAIQKAPGGIRPEGPRELAISTLAAQKSVLTDFSNVYKGFGQEDGVVLCAEIMGIIQEQNDLAVDRKLTSWVTGSRDKVKLAKFNALKERKRQATAKLPGPIQKNKQEWKPDTSVVQGINATAAHLPPFDFLDDLQAGNDSKK